MQIQLLGSDVRTDHASHSWVVVSARGVMSQSLRTPQVGGSKYGRSCGNGLTFMS
jgi:hypothetical protein